MHRLAVRALVERLHDAGIEVADVARAGGGVWCFGSRAAGCARPGSDWDVLVIAGGRAGPGRTRHGGLDIVKLGRGALDAWAATELAAHVAAYGVRLDPGSELTLRALPERAAPRKREVVAGRGRVLDELWSALQPAQRAREVLRLRRDVHRAWLLAQGAAIPPTALLEREWQAAEPRARARILATISVTPRLRRAIARGDEAATATAP